MVSRGLDGERQLLRTGLRQGAGCYPQDGWCPAGWQAAARAALSDARIWFEQAIGILKALPESQAALEQAFETRLELRPVLRQLGEGWQMLEHLREAEALAERLNDDRRRGRVCAFMTTVLSTLNELDDALVTGTRALEIARRLGDLRLRILSTTHLEQAYYYRSEYEHVVELAIDNLAALPADWAHEYFGMAVPASVFGRVADHEPRRARQIRRGGQVRGGGDPHRRTDRACVHHRLGALRREHAARPQGRLGEGALTGWALDRDAPVWKCSHPSSLGGRFLRLGDGADRRGGRGAEAGPGGRAVA
jgi:tetratricopeptide (TPR) repeat protein